MADANDALHYFYILQCNDDTFYAGYTIDVERRLKEHNDGIGAKYTRLAKRRPLLLLHYESFATKSEAMKQEYAFKQLTRKQKELYLSQAKDQE
jgi:putative endonuclease